MSSKVWSIKALLNTAADYLGDKGIESARLNAEVLLAHQLNKKRISLYLDFDQPLTEEEVSGFRTLIKRRLRREPLQYITGKQEFWSLPFRVNEHVLIPRPETEVLVEQGATLAKAMPHNAVSILDVGTGSGVIAISLAKEIPHGRFLATDISLEALNVARYNTRQHHLTDRIGFLQGDLFAPLSPQTARFHVIISNPPYVCTHEFQGLLPEVADYEPRLALDGGKDGMTFLKTIISEGHLFLHVDGWLLLEMAPAQVDQALSRLVQCGFYKNQTVIEDYSHRRRVILAQVNRKSPSP